VAIKAGTFYGVGVGPGDPELMTVKAWRLISTTPIIAYLVANGKDSTARAIAAPFIPEDATELAIDVPMRTEREPAMAAYDEGAARITKHLKAGQDVAMLCEGDPFFYGSFMYMHARLADRFETIVVPGVTSLTASAARVGKPLSARNDVIKVLPATMDPVRLAIEIKDAGSIAVIKVGRHFETIRMLIENAGLTDKALVIENATRADEKITLLKDIMGASVPYFTTILIYNGAESW
jgi:precorrin-2/cobalt-factor-2 C20-methyltransferase